MTIATTLKIILVLCILIIPLRGPSTKRKEKRWSVKIDKTAPKSNYVINEDGNLEEL